jgi:hypothetical protein
MHTGLNAGGVFPGRIPFPAPASVRPCVFTYEHKDILAWARKAIAADALATASVGDAARIAEFNKIASDQKRAVLDAIKKVNFAYLQVHRAGATPSENEFTLEPVQPLTKTGVLEHLTRNLYPPAYLAEHIQNPSQRVNRTRSRSDKMTDAS